MNIASNTQSPAQAGIGSARRAAKHTARKSAKPLGLLLIALLGLLGLLAAACGGGSAAPGAQVDTENNSAPADAEIDVSPAVAVRVTSTAPEAGSGSDDGAGDGAADNEESEEPDEGSADKQKSKDGKPGRFGYKFKGDKSFGSGSFEFSFGDGEQSDKDWGDKDWSDKDWGNKDWGNKDWGNKDWAVMYGFTDTASCFTRHQFGAKKIKADSDTDPDSGTDSDADSDTAREPDAQNVAALLAELTVIFPELNQEQAEALATAYDLCDIEIANVKAVLAVDVMGDQYRRVVLSLTSDTYRDFVDASRQQACDALSSSLEDLIDSAAALAELDWEAIKPVRLGVSVELAAQLLFEPTEDELQAIYEELLDDLKESLGAIWQSGIDALQTGEAKEDYNIMGCDVNLGFMGEALGNFAGLGKELGKSLGEGLGKSLGERFKRFDGSKLPGLDGFKMPKLDDLEEQLGSLGDGFGELLDDLLGELGDLDLDDLWQDFDSDPGDNDRDSDTDIALI